MSQSTEDTLSALAVMYERHGDPQRALVLGLSAMRLQDKSDPGLWLAMASAFLQTDAPDRTLAVLHRFESRDGFSRNEMHAALRLKTRALLALRRLDDARLAASESFKYASRTGRQMAKSEVSGI